MSAPGTRNQVLAPPNPGLQRPPLLYGRASGKSLAPEPGQPNNVVNDPTLPFVFQGDLRPPGPLLGQAQCNTRSCCCSFPFTPSLFRPRKLGCLLGIALPRGWVSSLSRSTLISRTTPDPQVTTKTPRTKELSFCATPHNPPTHTHTHSPRNK